MKILVFSVVKGQFLTFLSVLLLLLLCLPLQARPLRVGLYGGTFDPPTPGHEYVIETALRELQLDILYVLPNVKTDHKPGANPYELRDQWAKEVFSKYRGVQVSPAFLVAPYRAEGLDAVFREWTEQHQADQIFLVLGDESYVRNVEQKNLALGPNATVAVVERELIGKTYPKRFNGMPVLILGRSPKDFSSSHYRAQISVGVKPEGLHTRVWESMCELRLVGQVLQPAE